MKVQEVPIVRQGIPAPLPAGGAPNAKVEKYFLEYYEIAVRIAFRVLGNLAAAEDVAMEVFLKFHRNPLDDAKEHNIAGWFYRSVTRAALDALRSQSRRERRESGAVREQCQRGTADEFGEMLREDQARKVRAVLAQLKPVQAELLILQISGCTYEEIATILSLRISSVGAVLSRARRRFAAEYERIYGAYK
jgi:RNA polymerase sigma factor (sigma-70 family)